MKNKTVNLFILILLLGQYLYAQKTYDSGYILTTANDTIKGFILNEMDSELAYKINFKQNLSDTSFIEYSTSELSSFGFSSGRIFGRMKVATNNKTVNDSSYVFAKRIVEGKINLYVWRHEGINSKDFFVVNNKSKRKAQLTKPKKSEIKKDGKTYSKKDSRYKYYLTYVKDDKVENSKKVRFGEKSISKDIISFNESYQDEYPIDKYEEPSAYNYNILVGIPFNMNSGELHFRVGVYRDKTFVEKSNNLSYLSGIIYHHWNNNNDVNYEGKNGELNYRWQMLNIIPVGIKLQANPRRVTPYGYIGVGAAALLMTDYIFEDYENVESKTDFVPFPTVNVGAGVKIKVNSNFILAEITPTMNEVFFNLGYSF